MAADQGIWKGVLDRPVVLYEEKEKQPYKKRMSRPSHWTTSTDENAKNGAWPLIGELIRQRNIDAPVSTAESATPAQPPLVDPWPVPSGLPIYPVLRKEKDGVSDGFRTRSLLSHSQALYP
jgi:hypothetical protein